MTGDEPTDDRVGPDPVHAAVVVCCILGLVLVAGFLPAVDQVGGGDADAAGGGDDRPGGSATPPGDAAGGGDDASAGSLDVSVERATPGEQMRVEVTDDGEPVSGASVSVDGEEWGTTDDDGVLAAPTPYEESVNVTASAGDATGSERVSLPTDVDVTRAYVDADEEELQIRARLGGEPLSDAVVRVDGRRAATTRDDGVARVDLPDDRARIEVVRGEAEGAASIETDGVTLEVDNALFLPMVPLGPAEASVTMDGVPVKDAPVTVDGEQVATTDYRGQTGFRLPPADAATIGTDVVGRSDATELEGLAFNLAYTVLVVLGALFGLIVTYLRLFDLQARRRHRRWLRARLWRGGLLSAIAGLPAALVASGRSIASVFGRVGAGVGWVSQFGATLRLPRLALPSLSSLGAWLSALSLLPSLDRGSRSVGDAATDDGPSDGVAELPDDPVDPAVEGDDAAPDPTVRRAWHALVDRLGVAQRETRTPGQIARRAIDAGYPADAVDRLTAAFRDVEYGDRPETDDRVRAAYEALERIGADEEDER